MTDNEKAATFIGWFPGKEATDNPIVTPYKQAELKRKFGVYLREQAPDMSKPENYMQALETCGIKEWVIQRQMYSWEGQPDYGLRVFCYLDPWYDYDGLAGGRYEAGPCLTVADAVVKALAALYDAEHPDEARK